LFKQLPFFKKYTNPLQLCFSKDTYLSNSSILFTKQTQFDLLLGTKLTKLTKVLNTLFKLNKNVILVDYDYNYNYLPVQNNDLFSRSSKNFNKCIRFFNVSAVLFFNLKNKNFILKKLFTNKTINISISSNTNLNKFDIGLKLQNTKVIHYIVYVYLLNMYLSVKNNKLNINDSKLFFF
jgi:hypothetical protein